ncbi:hypothetical protein ACTOB_002020 [Actinoplanes oblitus]|uniref:Transmembrane protein n=1 Tax=Actinoplanes oblitus TaxID=3040509 RepID=A0ABY8WNG3_9ACTN|nr:hypothetical protein [Actinoplanes oblitus]WIM98420.1 hypothetical protein ACTOB_002020 [Actinoplanes oblitus]
MIGRRVARRFGWERNVLRRRTDRIESLMVFVLVFSFLAGAPLLAWWAGEASYRQDLRAQQWERRHLFQVDAVLVEGASTAVAGSTRSAGPQTAKATWTAPDGTARSGVVQTGTDARTGTRVRIWVDDSGTPRMPPAERNPTSQAVLVGAAVLLCLCAALVGLHRIGRGALDRHRDRAWGREWMEVGPRWSRDSRWGGRF